MSNQGLEERAQALVEELSPGLAKFKGYDVRMDAGEEGAIFVALRDAKRDVAAAEGLAQTLVQRLTAALSDEPALDFAVALGTGIKDAVIRVKLERRG